MIGFTLLALLTLCYWLFMLRDTIGSRRLMLRLPRVYDENAAKFLEEKVTYTDISGLPLVSVIVAAKEEEFSIENTVQKLMLQNYPRLEIIAINDRSQDGTGRKLDELRKRSEGNPVSLTVIHIIDLPSGWLGKNHALYQGYVQARGQYILFTDADILFQPNTVADAVRFMKEQEADHLTLAPEMVVRGFWLRAFVQYFFFAFSLYIRPWRANIDSQHKHGMGVGAFNLLTRQAYERIGTHKAFALRPDDDLQLGIRVKQAGLRQRLASGRDHIAVEWYKSLNEAFRGLEKNVFSGFQYRITTALLSVLGQLLMFLFPFIAVFVLNGWPAWLFGCSILIMVTVYLLLIRSLIGHSGREALVFPLTVCLLCCVIIRSVSLTLLQGGIYWRGTFYSLDELKNNRF